MGGRRLRTEAGHAIRIFLQPGALSLLTLLPGPLTGETVVQADARFPAEMRAKLAGVGEGVPLVARPCCFLTNDRLSSAELLQLVDDVPNGRGFPAADVVDLAGMASNGGDGGSSAI